MKFQLNLRHFKGFQLFYFNFRLSQKSDQKIANKSRINSLKSQKAHSYANSSGNERKFFEKAERFPVANKFFPSLSSIQLNHQLHKIKLFVLCSHSQQPRRLFVPSFEKNIGRFFFTLSQPRRISQLIWKGMQKKLKKLELKNYQTETSQCFVRR